MQRKNIAFIFLLVCLRIVSYADTYPEVVFDNSLVKGAYAKSNVAYSGDSWVENINKHLLVSDSLFFTPGNSLSLRYVSRDSGHWESEVQYSRQKFHYRVSVSDVLSLKLYVSTSNTATSDLPLISIKQKNSESIKVDLSSYIADFGSNVWIDVKIPISDFNGIATENPIESIAFTQNGSSQEDNHLFLDQIEFLPKGFPTVTLTSAAVLSEVSSFGQHIELKWRLPLTPSIRYIKIYRSEDNENFQPVAIRPIYMQSCLDYVPEPNKKYYYKIAWVDYNYKESPFSETKEVDVEGLSEDALVDLMQSAHVNYFVENFDINSGLYIPFRTRNKAVVSIKESGYAILSLIIGAERSFVNRQIALNRISKMTFFLLRAQNKNGVFPAYFDGRKGIPDYYHESTDYDLNVTSTIIESLLIARAYFSEDTPEENDLRRRITKLWERVEWDKFVAEGTDDVLLESYSYLSDTLNNNTLGGINESFNTYMLAMSAPKFNIPITAFENGVCHQMPHRSRNSSDLIDSLNNDQETLEETLPFQKGPMWINSELTVDTVDSSRVSIVQDTSLYGLNLKWGARQYNLSEVFRPFYTINPHMVHHHGISFANVVRDYISLRKRKDNEYGVGATSSDIWGFYRPQDSTGRHRINPAIAISSVFLIENYGSQSMKALYEEYGDRIFTEYGFRSWLDLRDNDISDEYIALNQISIIVMLENARSGMIWELYQEIPEIKETYKRLFDGK